GVEGAHRQPGELRVLVAGAGGRSHLAHVGVAVREQHDRDRLQQQLLLVDHVADLAEERVEVGVRVHLALGEDRVELLLDLLDRPVLERLDRVERLRLVLGGAADRAHEQRVGHFHLALAVQVRRDVAREEVDRVVEVAAVHERAADVHTDEHDQPRSGRFRRLRGAVSLGCVLRQVAEVLDRVGRATRGQEQHREDEDPEDTHGQATCWLLGSSSPCNVRASLKSAMLLSGSSSMCRFAHSIVTKFSVAATSCMGGTMKASSSFCPSLPAHSNSLRSWFVKPSENRRNSSGGAPPGFAITPWPEMMARIVGVPALANRNHDRLRTPSHTRPAIATVPPMPRSKWGPACWATHGTSASTNSRYRNPTSTNNATDSTTPILTIVAQSRLFTASVNDDSTA